MRWVLVAIALSACKDAPSRQPSSRQAPEPTGPPRYPEVDAAIDAMRPALLLAEPTETISACVGKLEVVAIDHEAALLIAAGRPAPPGARFMTSPESEALVRYASKSPLSPDDVTAIQAWARARPAGFVWGFLDGALVDGKYEGVLHVIDAKTKAVLCHTQIAASSADNVAQAVSDKLAVLRAGTDVVAVPDPLTDNRGPALAPGRIVNGVTQNGAVCITYRDLAAEKDAFSCHPTMESCMHHRVALKTDPKQRASQVSACTVVGRGKTR